MSREEHQPEQEAIASLSELSSIPVGGEVMLGPTLFIRNSDSAWEENINGILLSDESLWSQSASSACRLRRSA